MLIHKFQLADAKLSMDGMAEPVAVAE